MYESFYNLKVEPFRLSPDHRFCFSHKSYAKAKAYMQYAIHRAEGFVMVTGKPGTGKTTLVNDLVDGLSQSRIVVATIVSTQLEADDLLRLVSCNFGLDVDAPNKAVVLQGLSVRLRRYHEEGTRALLIIDEAQDLSASALEELRLLTNLQLNNQPLLQIFLVGQENLRDLVQKPSMEQVHQRLVAACHLEALSEPDTKAYIKHRLDRVGWKNDPVIDEAVYPVVFQFSKGVPRRINLICSRFLLHGCVEEKHRIRAADVRTVVGELQHEQLTPVGFKADLPPLVDDDEELDIDQDAVVEADENQLAGVEPEQAVSETGPITEEDPASAASPSPEAATRGGNEIADICSLEEQVKREEGYSATDSEDSKQDVIQENYFSLSDAVDLPSEPIPLHKPEETPAVGQRYGDRFASAKLHEAGGGARTHYYNEYQAGIHSQGVVSGKRGMLSITLLFLLGAIVLSIALYLFSPRLLQDGLMDLEQQFGPRASRLSEEPAPAKSDPLPVRAELEKNETDSEVMRPVEQGVTVQNATAAPNTPSQSEVSALDGGEPGAEQSSSPIVDVQKKTAPEIELSHVAPLPETTASGGAAKNPVAQKPAASDDLLHWWRSEHAQTLVPPNQAPSSDGVLASDAIAPGVSTTDKIALASQLYPITHTNKKRPEAIIKGAAVLTPLATASMSEKWALPDPVDSPSIESLTSPSAANSGSKTDIASIPANSGNTQSESKPLDQRSESEVADKSGFAVVQNSQPSLRKKILFSIDSTAINDEYSGLLSEVVDWLQLHTGQSVRIIGYADSIGDTQYNQALSLKRAKEVAAYLADKNIAQNRLHIEGRGVYPVTGDGFSNGSNTRQMQRLVEIVSSPAGD